MRLIACVLLSAASASAQEARFESQVDVERLLTTVRVTDGRGRPLAGLTAADFTVKVAGVEVEVEAVDWIEGPMSVVEAAEDVAGEAPRLILQEHGRLIVLVFQIDFISSRLSGTYRMSRRAQRMLDDLEAKDEVAIAVFRTHLQLHSDFSTDREQLAEALQVTNLLQNREVEPRADGPSLARHLDLERARAAANLRQGLAALGDGLLPIDGPKAVVLFGYGLGDTVSGRVILGRDYERARARLLAARATVFALDVTDADRHTLEFGLREMAEETGGFYERTHQFPGIAMAKLEGALEGAYELTLVSPELVPGEHRLDVRVGRKGARVLARPTLFLGPAG